MVLKRTFDTINFIFGKSPSLRIKNSFVYENPFLQNSKIIAINKTVMNQTVD